MERVVAAQMLPKSVSHDSELIIKEIHQTTTSKYVNDVRQELFGGKASHQILKNGFEYSF